MFPILKTKKEIEELKEKGLKEGVDFIVGASLGISKGYPWDDNDKEEERWEISFPGILT